MKKACVAIFLVFAFVFHTSAAEKSSENDDKLKGWLKKFPEADKNKDGILTMSEALEFRKSKKGAKKKNQAAPSARTVSGKSIPTGQEVKGYNGLFMGHSFFRPAAETLMSIIPDTNVVNHTEYIVMSGGAGGSPEMLWRNESKRNAGLKYLDTGKVEFFAMTYYDKNNSAVDDYSKWFDYAISKNSNITFMIALPWGTHLYKATQADVDASDEGYKKYFDELIVPLRKKYPNNKIIYCPYGLGVYELIDRLKKGKLPGIKHILSPDKSKARTDQILRDPLGHGTDLVTLLNSLIWMQTIYKYDLSTIDKKYRAPGLPGIDLNEIAMKIYKKVEPYNAIYK